MSIIEKAVGKLGSSPKPEQPQPTSIESADERSGRSSQDKVSHSSRAAEGTVKLRTIEIPFDNLHQRGMLTPAVPRSLIAEEYRSIKRPILKNIDGKTASELRFANLVMVTSALEGDGKTFSSINLAISIAMEMDRTVLFVDADVAKATAGSLLGVPRNSPGLIDVLEGNGTQIGDVICRTNMDKLSILPAGRSHEKSNELLASEGMSRLMGELSQRYSDRVIVFDSPPLLLTTEAGVLASFVGQIVFVVSADRTPQQTVVEAIEHISEDKMVGMVLNRARRRKFIGFGYGYGLGYGYGYAENNPVAPAPRQSTVSS